MDICEDYPFFNGPCSEDEQTFLSTALVKVCRDKNKSSYNCSVVALPRNMSREATENPSYVCPGWKICQ